MRIACPHCGERDVQEFSYLGDASLMRRAEARASAETMHDYVYRRDNPAGPHRELWYHAAGCHAWLAVSRDTRTHAITAAAPARDVALGRSAGMAVPS